MSKKFKLQVLTNEDLVSRIDNVASKLSMSRSAFCAFIIAQGVYAYEKSLTMTDDIGAMISSELQKMLSEQAEKK